jgi:fructan beta-fructosidase
MTAIFSRNVSTACVVALALSVAASTASPETYDEQYRPQYHFTPATNWMNDPNGLVYHKGNYHLFFQHNPTGDIWGNMSWGHALSKDLMHWDEQPLALSAFDSPAGSLKEFYFSGSAVTDTKRTSGWGSPRNPPLVAIYTSNYPDNVTLPNGRFIRAETQAQSIAYSIDDGLTWNQYEGNPVIAEPPPQYADEWKNFRDPFVFWHEPQKHWVMVLAISLQHKLLFYTSNDLKKWIHVGEFGPVNAVGGIWECPSLTQFYVDDRSSNPKWVLMLGLNPGGPALPQGSGTQYLVGSFDGTTFVPDADTIRTPAADRNATGPDSTVSPEANWADWGPDYYAAVPWNGLPTNEHVTIGWMNDWAYATQIPTSPWRSAMSIPRKLSLKTIKGKVQLLQQPHPFLDKLESGRPLYQRSWKRLQSGNSTLPFKIKTFDLELTFSAGKKASRVGLDLQTGVDGAGTVVGYDFSSGQMFLDRTTSGNTTFNALFPGTYYAPLSADKNGQVKLRVLLDWSSVEVFGGQGESTITAQIFPLTPDFEVKLFSEGEVKDVKLNVRSVRSIW